MTSLSKVDSKHLLPDSLLQFIKSNKGKVAGLALIAIVASLVAQKKNKQRDRLGAELGSLRKGKGNVDSVFFHRLFKMLKIVFPSWKDPIFLDFTALNIALVIRTILSKNFNF